ncbi:flagellar export protein FliJ [Paenibacillus mendelii]|uniref:Flagellar FliJ protein n=1 Tax=Paenibacillus mendelii TaxID=206163 RepID=A0ABV6JGL4_9BACL|nr:flagellar export protein FliJ [Paenibacillus mendelii]MCQ6557918.1 flagellar export protein FliJ [Paenibacillus mendelii]
MAKFQYTYQKIVDLKSSEKTQAEWLLSSAVSKLNAEEMTLENLLKERSDWLEKLQEASEKVVSLSSIRVVQLYLEFIESSIAQKRSDVRLAKQEVESSRSHLTDRMMDEKVWLKAKDHARDRFRFVALAKEQNELDEMATVRFVAPAR